MNLWFLFWSKILLGYFPFRFFNYSKQKPSPLVMLLPLYYIIEKIGDENIVNQIELDNKIILSYWIDFNHIPKINVAIASSVTSNARIYMSKFKNNPEFVLYYTDTDSYF
uniref:DNA-directed DNA polymerase n=1 Tax=Fomitiporia mediterranea TaxID=208960 RepID=A0A5B9RD85_9AGAM|nr:hypothetical protein Fomme_000100 [Fomitiporia mediterranea]QEG57110.1 hypothetical protein Fomme_000100 [Fomitiporia mediterranea]